MLTRQPVTAADVARNEARTCKHVERVIALLSLQPPESPVHNAEVWPTSGGTSFSIPVPVGPNKPQARIHVCSWSRGWSIYVDEDTPTGGGAYGWRDVKREYRGLQRPLYAPRDKTGPWYVPVEHIVDAVLYLVDKLERLRKARELRAERQERRRKTWYWPRSVERRERLVRDPQTVYQPTASK